MKQFKWPRPPLVLGLVLGDTIERYMFISVERYGLSWLLRPVVAVLFDPGDHRPGAAVPAGHPQAGRRASDDGASFQAPTFHPSQLFTMFMIALIGGAVVVATCPGTSAPRSCRWWSAPSR